MPAGFRHHIVGKTLTNIRYRDIAQVHFVGKLVIMRTFTQSNQFNFIRITKIFAPLLHSLMFYPQHGGRIVTIHYYSMSSFHQCMQQQTLETLPEKRNTAYDKDQQREAQIIHRVN